MYYTIVDNNIVTAEKENILTEFYENVKEAPSDFEYGKYIIKDGDITLDPDYEKNQEEAEKLRINMLHLTAADVERAIYKTKGMDFDDILELVKSNPPENLDIKALKIELKANNFYRGNPYIDKIGNILGFSKLQLDNFFESGDYTKLLEVN